MHDNLITATRLVNQQIAATTFKSPQSIVRHMGAVQAQDYAGAKWAIGLRLLGVTDAHMDGALADGNVIRTHVLRPTWHFVAPQDVRWMLRLSAPRINQACAYNYKRMELDTPIFNKCNKILEKVLEGKQLDRLAIAGALTEKGIATDDLRLVHLLIRAEIDGVICSGGREGKQFTYALLDERVPSKEDFVPAEPLAELALRYFTSHGPATLQDFTWWSGLTGTDAKQGLEMAKKKLVSEAINDKVYWMAEPPAREKPTGVYLLPAFDEYTVAYKDRSDIIDLVHTEQNKGSILNPVLVIDGKAEGTWKRTVKGATVTVEIAPFNNLSKAHIKQAEAAAQVYATFMELKATIIIK